MFIKLFDTMGKAKPKKEWSILQQDLQTIKREGMAEIIGGKIIRKKSRFIKGLTSITPQ